MGPPALCLHFADTVAEPEFRIHLFCVPTADQLHSSGRTGSTDTAKARGSRLGFLANLLRRKFVIWTLIVLPGLWPAWPFFVEKDPTALTDPLKFVLHHLGFIACLLLVTVLAFTPLRVLFPKWDVALALNRHRRLVGVSAFAYALLHLAVQVLYQYDGTYEGTVEQLGKELQKPFQLTGLVALTILFVLTVTSVNAFVRWLGGKRWKRLHRLAYVAAALVAYHQATATKTFPMQVVWIFAPLVGLEIARFLKQRAKSRPLNP
jgi:sulfoxide reductase heme-binding subunit YedZ